MYQLEPNELAETLALPAEGRLDYFISKVVENDEIWTLAFEESLMVLGTEDLEGFIVLFPHADFGSAWFENSGLEEAELVGMELEGWLEGNFKELEEAEIVIALFPTPNEEAIYLSPLELQSKIKVAKQLGK